MQGKVRTQLVGPHGWRFGSKKKKSRQGNGVFSKFINKTSKKFRKKKYHGQGK